MNTIRNPDIWSMMFSVLLALALGIHGIRRKNAPGALPFVLMMAFAIPWFVANAMRMVATDGAVRIFWFKFETACILPLATAGMCFALEYAGLGRFLTKRTLSLLVFSPLAFSLLIATNEVHHLVWKWLRADRDIRVELGPAHWIGIGYGQLLSLAHLSAMAWLFARSPRHRWVAAGLFVAPLITRVASLFNIWNKSPVLPLNPMVLVANAILLLYALAFFRLRMFDVVPVARATVMERMKEGLLVLDAEHRLAYINETARRLLKIAGTKNIGLRARDLLRDCPELLETVAGPDETSREISLGEKDRWHQVSTSKLRDRRGFHLGRLVWLQDVTERRDARAQILDQQRTLAMLEERELLARELHDGVGQMLAGIHLQAQSARELLAMGETEQAGSRLARLVDTTREAKESVRAYLVGVKVASDGEKRLLPALDEYLKHYRHNFGIRAELVVSPALDPDRIDTSVEVQLRPIVLEALANARKHAGPCSARVILAPCDDSLRVTVEDDGRGFEPGESNAFDGFGLRSMRGRAEAAGGSFEVDSAPGKGTRVSVLVPLRKEQP